MSQQSEELDDLQDVLANIVDCATKPFNGLPRRVDEMTDNELAIFKIASEVIGRLWFIGQEVVGLLEKVNRAGRDKTKINEIERLRSELAETRKQLVYGFHEEALPRYMQSDEAGEICVLVTADECNELVGQVRELTGVVSRLRSENSALRKLIRCETIKPPADVHDDMTTELAVQVTELESKLRAIEREATSATCASLDCDPTPTGEERLGRIMKIINEPGIRPPLTVVEPLEICICAAIKTPSGVIRGHRHGDCFEHMLRNKILRTPGQDIQGFITSRNRFVDRREAFRLQKKAGVVSASRDGFEGEVLLSEDLY